MHKLSGLGNLPLLRSARPIRLTKTLIALAILGSLSAIAIPMQAYADTLKVETRDGPVRGFLNKGVAEFLGIPYAAAPIGDLRWRPPKHHAPWTNVLNARAFAPICAQITTLGVFAGPANNNEDCLYLNIFTPDVDTKEKLPVIFWIHGGGNVDGEANDYDGTKLASQGHTVVVTFNYRLGLLGWLAHPALDAEGHLFANYGTLDQQEALKWVKRNIRAFGGDPDNITVGGQSAGSFDTEANVVSPLAAGLFQHAIFESVVTEPVPLAWAESVGTQFSVAAGCGSDNTPATATCLRSLSVAQIMALQGTESASGPYVLYLIADGEILPASGFYAAFKSGNFNHMPIMSGSTHDEWNFLIAIDEYFSGPPRVATTAADFTNYVNAVFSGNAGPGGSPPTYPAGTAAKVFAQYPLSDYPTPQLAFDALGTDSAIVCSQLQINRVLSKKVPVYAYEFNDLTPPSYFPNMPGYVPLAYHTADIQYLFPLYHGGPLGIPHVLDKQQETLSDELVTAWTNFAWTGNPNGMGDSPWPLYVYKKDKPAYLLSENVPILTTLTDEQFSAEHHCDFWETILSTP
jgi:para-nitrobenzyl esterase